MTTLFSSYPRLSQTRFVLVVLLASALFFTTSAMAQEQPEKWLGTLDIGIGKIRLLLNVSTDDGGKVTSEMISLDQGNATIVCDSTTRTKEQLAFQIKSAIKFDGKLNEDENEAVGTFSQSGKEFELTLKKVDEVPVEQHVQTWTGVLKAGLQEFDFQFRVFQVEDGMMVKLDSFDEKLEGIPCAITREGNEVTIKVPIAANPATYTGVINDEVTRIEGEWDQAGQKYPLILKKVALASTREMELKRPQTPKPPFEYDSRDISIENKKANCKLAGTLTNPKGDGPFPTVVMISGSGAQDRDETLFGHKPFLVIADHLAKHGIAVFRFDDRGTAESTGDFGSATSADFAEDVEAIVDQLKQLAKVDATKIILCGHSEGGMISPMVGSRRDDIAGVVMLAGTGVDGRAIAFSQSRLMAAAAGASDSDSDINDVLLKAIFKRQDEGGALDDAFLEEVGEKMRAMLPEDRRGAFDPAVIKAAVARTDTPWARYFATYDPKPALEKVTCPVLALIGEKDLQVDPKLNNPAIEAALKKAGNSDFEIHVLPSLNHLFQECETGALSEYNKIEQTIAPEMLDRLTAWLVKRYK